MTMFTKLPSGAPEGSRWAITRADGTVSFAMVHNNKLWYAYIKTEDGGAEFVGTGFAVDMRCVEVGKRNPVVGMQAIISAADESEFKILETAIESNRAGISVSFDEIDTRKCGIHAKAKPAPATKTESFKILAEEAHQYANELHDTALNVITQQKAKRLLSTLEAIINMIYEDEVNEKQ